MRNLSLLLALSCAVLSAPHLTAQVAPGKFFDKEKAHAVFSNKYLSAITKPGTFLGSGATTLTIQQISCTKTGISGLGAGKFAVAMTVGGLGTYYGGPGTTLRGVVMGTYDRSGTTETFVPNLHAKAMNNSGCFGLMLEPGGGLFAAVDWSATEARLSFRSTNSTAFHAPVVITSAAATTSQAFITQPTGWADPAPAMIDGSLHLVYVPSLSGNSKYKNGLVYRKFSLTYNSAKTAITAAQLHGPEYLIWTAPTGQRAHSPSPVADVLGDCVGLMAASNTNNTNNSDIYWVSGISGKDPGLMVAGANDANWMNNGAVCGGTLMFAHSYSSIPTAPKYYDYIEYIDCAWMLGNRPKIGTKATLTLGCKNAGTPPVVPSVVALSLAHTVGVKIPGWNGMYGLDNKTFLYLTNTVSVTRDDIATWTISVPNQKIYQGVTVRMQALSSPLKGTPTLTNTTQFVIR